MVYVCNAPSGNTAYHCITMLLTVALFLSTQFMYYYFISYVSITGWVANAIIDENILRVHFPLYTLK